MPICYPMRLLLLGAALSLGGCGGGGGSAAPVAPAALTIPAATLPAATTDQAFTAALAATGGSGAYSWSVAAGTLPPGLTLSAAGILSGTPTTPGLYTVTTAVTDDETPAQSTSRTYNLAVASTGATIQVSLATTPSALTVGSSFTGFSYEKSQMSGALFSPTNAGLIALFERLGPSLLRIGGNSVDDTLWNPTGAGETAHQASPPDLVRLAAFLQACNWQVLYGIEFLNEQATPVTTADTALVAAEAVAALQTLGDRLYGFELGNEPDLYHARMPGFDYPQFQAQWEAYHSAILVAVSAAIAAGTLPAGTLPKFTGPAAAGSRTGFVGPFAQAESADIFLLTQHYYLANGQSPESTMARLLTPDTDIPGELAALQTSATTNGIASGFRMAEANSYYNGGAPGVSDGFGTALWAIDYLFTNAWGGAAGVNFHGGGDGPGYTPIADDGTAVVEARPEFYGLYLFAEAAQGQLVATTPTPAIRSLKAYAVAGAGTSMSVVLVNTSSTDSNNAVITFNSPVSTATFVTLTGPSLTSTSGQLLNGAAIAPDGTWPAPVPPALPITDNQIQVPVAAGSALLLRVQ